MSNSAKKLRVSALRMAVLRTVAAFVGLILAGAVIAACGDSNTDEVSGEQTTQDSQVPENPTVSPGLPATAPSDAGGNLDGEQQKFVDSVKSQGVTGLPDPIIYASAQSTCPVKKGQMDEGQAKTVLVATLSAYYGADENKAREAADKIFAAAQRDLCK